MWFQKARSEDPLEVLASEAVRTVEDIADIVAVAILEKVEVGLHCRLSSFRLVADLKTIEEEAAADIVLVEYD